MSGRPLRFLAGVGAGWIGLRVVLLWPDAGSLPEALREIVPLPVAARASATLPAPARAGAVPPPVAPLPVTDRRRLGGIAPRVDGPTPAATARWPLAAPVAPVPLEPRPAQARAGRTGVLVPPPPPIMARRRLSISAWGIARGGRGLGASPDAPQLGGTQGGVRIDYSLAHGIAATARVAAPAAGAGRELALGMAWRPARVPLRFVAEYRVALDDGASGPAVGVSGGVSAVPLPLDFRLESFAQAGAIWRDRAELYVDGSARATRAITEVGPVAIDAGAGAWGGAQRGVERLDIGPTLGARVPVAGGALRVSVDWRQRVAGSARPGSGPALTVGADF